MWAVAVFLGGVRYAELSGNCAMNFAWVVRLFYPGQVRTHLCAQPSDLSGAGLSVKVKCETEVTA